MQTMDSKCIINQGERAKYFVRSDKWNFSFETNSYRLEILYGMTGKNIIIPKSEFQLLNGKWVFSFPTNDIVGKVKARLVMEMALCSRTFSQLNLIIGFSSSLSGVWKFLFKREKNQSF